MSTSRTSVYEYTVFPQLGTLKIIEKLQELPWTAYIGAAGMYGKTAYTGWKEFSDAKPGEIVFITVGGGPVGSMVIQLAKKAGMKIIASAGSEAKVPFMKALGADVVFNYKTTDTCAVLAKEGPVDVYWENMGGDVLDAALEFAGLHARFLNLSMVVGKSLHIHGILVFRLLETKCDKEFYETIPPKLARGEIKWWEDVSKSLDKVGDVLLAVQKGTNKGKAVVVVVEE
ncbi:hypothetical protein C8R44DRAFT_886615 [Mycena epipterygia]|nr:hypothetical protein C8R44DRAFT_886615 [Mycena epipterygia]